MKTLLIGVAVSDPLENPLKETNHLIPDAEEAAKNVTLSQSFNMKSACGTPQYTNFTAGFKECLDYIWFQTDVFKSNSFVELPSNEELEAHIAIPSVVFPSDHVALIAELEWLK